MKKILITGGCGFIGSHIVEYFHDKYKNVAIFNGFGSKGVSLIPYFAMNLADHICFGKKMYLEVNPQR